MEALIGVALLLLFVMVAASISSSANTSVARVETSEPIHWNSGFDWYGYRLAQEFVLSHPKMEWLEEEKAFLENGLALLRERLSELERDSESLTTEDKLSTYLYMASLRSQLTETEKKIHENRMTMTWLEINTRRIADYEKQKQAKEEGK